MRSSLPLAAMAALLLCACADTARSGAEPRNPFGVKIGAEDGNTFSATSATPGGGNDPAPPVAAARQATAPAPAPAAATAPAPAPVVVAVATLQAASGAASHRITIDANAFAAVFGTSANLVRPTAAQLMQLDSLSLVAADAARVELQTRILACRRAGESCQLSNY